METWERLARVLGTTLDGAVGGWEVAEGPPTWVVRLGAPVEYDEVAAAARAMDIRDDRGRYAYVPRVTEVSQEWPVQMVWPL